MPISVTIITASFNSEKNISNCMDSVEGQSYNLIEHIIVDGQSTDNTVALLKPRLNKNVKLVSEPDRGIYDAFNKGLRRANGDIITFLNSDDVYASETIISQVVEAFEANNGIDAVYGDIILIDEFGKLVRYWKSGHFAYWKLKCGWMPPHPTLFVRREWYEKTGLFDSNLTISADYKKILEIFMSEKIRPIYLPKILVKMQAGGVSNGSVNALIRSTREDWLVLRMLNFSVLGSMLAVFSKKMFKINQILSARFIFWRYK